MLVISLCKSPRCLRQGRLGKLITLASVNSIWFLTYDDTDEQGWQRIFAMIGSMPLVTVTLTVGLQGVLKRCVNPFRWLVIFLEQQTFHCRINLKNLRTQQPLFTYILWMKKTAQTSVAQLYIYIYMCVCVVVMPVVRAPVSRPSVTLTVTIYGHRNLPSKLIICTGKYILPQVLAS